MEISALKEELCEVCHLMWQQGWTASNGGNVSVKAEEGVFITTPTGVCKGILTPDKLVTVDAEGALIEANAGYRPSSELKMHLRCYRERPDVRAVVHAHPPTATGFAAAGRAIDDYAFTEGVVVLGNVPLAPYATPSTEEVPDSITELLADHDAMLLANHGALTVASELWRAFNHMEDVEVWAKIALTARLLGGAKEIERDKLELLFDMHSKMGLPKQFPGYKKY